VSSLLERTLSSGEPRRAKGSIPASVMKRRIPRRGRELHQSGRNEAHDQYDGECLGDVGKEFEVCFVPLDDVSP
jgi:hypothetical protein